MTLHSRTLLAAPRAALLAAALAAASLLGGCGAVVVGGAAVGAALSATDRRTTGTQVEDESIELKAVNRASELLGDRGHVNVTSYNRSVLITGEVPSEASRAALEQAIGGIENVRGTVNETAVMAPTSMTVRSNDSYLTSLVKAGFVDAKDLQANSIKVVTERSTVYLMGRVTEREANRAAEVARGIGGVTKVVKVFELISEAELAQIQTK
ncbi:MAG: BON domain-containing protein [Burkholderiaceae bacterium]|nr:BON domain-containing protein [Burkholderiaceae bacterium]